MMVLRIRALGFAWPGCESVKQYAVKCFGNVDLQATLVALRRGLEVYEGQVNEMRSYERTWNADASDARGDVETKAADMRRGIQLVEAIVTRERGRAAVWQRWRGRLRSW